MPKHLINRYSRYSVFIACLLFTIYGVIEIFINAPSLFLKINTAFTSVLVIIGIIDLNQNTYAVRKNYPIIGNIRYLLKYFRPEIRQYFIESDGEAVPFSHTQRNLVYTRARNLIAQSNRPFGTLENVYATGYQFIAHSIITIPPPDPAQFRILIGGNSCQQPYSASILNISAMSFGALSANAISSLNSGAKMGNFAHNTGEGGISPYHRQGGGDLIWQIGSGYFGCCTEEGKFDPIRFQAQANEPQVKMIEVKISQGAKPGHGGVLPKDKISAEIAATRGISADKDCISPANHSSFSTPIELLEFIQKLRELSSGKPVGFKLCIGHPWEFMAIAKAMLTTHILPDFIVIDGKEGGTGAAPVEFSDHIGTPLQDGLLFVHNVLVGMNLRDQIKLGVSGKMISAFDITRILAIGADWINSGRGFLFSLGCIQALTCHTNTCPTGIATQDSMRQQSLVVSDKKTRVYNFHKNTLHAFSEILGASGVSHPSQLLPQHLSLRNSENEIRLFSNLYYYLEPGSLLKENIDSSYYSSIWEIAQANSFAPKQNL